MPARMLPRDRRARLAFALLLSQFYTILPEEVLKGVEKGGANTDTWCIVSVGQPTHVGCGETAEEGGWPEGRQVPSSCYEPCKMSLTGEGSKEAVGYEIAMCTDAPPVSETAPDCPYPGHGDGTRKPALYIFYLEWTTCASGTRTRDATCSRAHQIRRGRPTRLPRARVLPRELVPPHTTSRLHRTRAQVRRLLHGRSGGLRSAGHRCRTRLVRLWQNVDVLRALHDRVGPRD